MNLRKILYITDLNPEPWTAPTASVQRIAGGKSYAKLVSGERLKNYQEGIRQNVRQACPDLEPFPDDIPLQFMLLVWRQLDSYISGRGRTQKRHVADATNIQKATEDALQKILYKNDSQIKWASTCIIEQTETTSPAMLIIVEPFNGLYFDADVLLELMKLIPAPEIPGNVRFFEGEA